MKPNFFYLYTPNLDIQETLYYTESGNFIKVLKTPDCWVPDSTHLVKGIQDIDNLRELREPSIEEKFLFLYSHTKFSTSWSQFIPRFNALLEHGKIIEEQIIGGKTFHPLVMNYFRESDGYWGIVGKDLYEITDSFNLIWGEGMQYDKEVLLRITNILIIRRNFYKKIVTDMGLLNPFK